MQAVNVQEPMSTTTSSYLGSWKKAPLVYLVFEVVLPPMQIGYPALLDAFSDRFVNDYPIRSYLNSQTLNVSEKGVELSNLLVNQFVNIGRDAGISISQGQISYHVSKYTDSKVMLAELQKVLSVFEEIFPARPILSTSIRVIDVVTPVDGLLAIGAAVVDSFKAPLAPEKLTLSQHVSISSFSNDKGIQCTLKSYGNVSEAGLLPADLSPLPLTLFGPSNDALTSLRLKKPIGIIDTSAADVSVEVWSTARVMVRFEAIKSLMHEIFLHVTTEEARRYWETGNTREAT